MDERALFHPQLYACFAAQRWPDRELVVIDTGDYPSPFLERMSWLDDRLVYRHYRLLGTAWSVGLKRNLAVHLASGEVIVHADDDDLYAPGYIDRMISVMAGADAVTLSSWYVCDACTGLVAQVSPADDGSQDSWVLGYGFSHVYRREVAVRHPFPHDHFGEDYKFMLHVRNSPGSRGVRTLRDEQGIVLHMQQGTNLSNSHGVREVPLQQVWSMPVSELPGFREGFRAAACGGRPPGDEPLASPFVSIGEAFRMYIRPSPHQREVAMRREMRLLGVAPLSRRCSAWEASRCPEETDGALASCCVRRRQELFVEPGRAFSRAQRFRDEALLPGDVPRSTPAERLALLHLARMLLRRCPARLAPETACEGWLRLELRALSHIAFLALLLQFARVFRRVRLEVDFESEGGVEDPEAEQRALMLKLLAEKGILA